jgi:hypothetical protein
VRVGSMSIDRIVAVSPAEKMASRSKIRKRGADSKGKVSRSCWATQAAVGVVVTAQQDPEDPVRGPDVGVPPPGQGGELLAEGQVLDNKMASRTHGREERRQEGYEEADHRAGENPGPGRNRQRFQRGRSFGER